MDGGSCSRLNMGAPSIAPHDGSRTVDPSSGDRLDVAVLNVGNPQCVVFADELPRKWH